VNRSRAAATLACAVTTALVLELTCALIDAGHHMVFGSGARHPLLVLACLGSSTLKGVALGLLAGGGAVLLGGGRSAGAGWAGGAVVASTLSALAFLLWLPKAVEIGTAPGMAIMLLILAAALGFGLTVARLVPSRIGPGSLALIWLAGVLATVPLLGPARRGAIEPPSAALATRDRTSVLLIVLDTLRADRLGVYGSSAGLSPALDALAAESVVFSRSISTSNHTLPSHASLLTGLYPVGHGVRGQGRQFSLENQALAERLGAAGWSTFAVVANAQLQGHLGWSQGFQLYDDGLISSYTTIDWVKQTSLGLLLGKLGIRAFESVGLIADALEVEYRASAPAVVERALTTLESIGDRPCFALLNFMEPHYPYLPPGVSVEGGARAANRDLKLALTKGSHLREGTDPALVRRIEKLYNGEVRHLDQQIGRLLRGIESLGRLDDMVIVVTADHGEHLGEYGRMLHSATLFREVIDVPLLIRCPESWPDSRRGVIEDRVVSSADVGATILDLAGIEANTQGVSLLPALVGAGGASAESHQVVAESFGDRVLAWDRFRAFFEQGELQRVAAWGDDSIDLRETRPELEAEALARYRRWVERNTVRVASREAEIDEALAKELRALGYVD